MEIKLQASKNIKQFGPLFDGLFKDFYYALWDSILMWCNVKENTIIKKRFWKVFLIKYQYTVVGLIGLYSIPKNRNTSELWIGSFAVLPAYRNKYIGKAALIELFKKAKQENCTVLYAYVKKNNRNALRFYKRHGFKRISNVEDYIRVSKIPKSEFEDMQD